MSKHRAAVHAAVKTHRASARVASTAPSKPRAAATTFPRGTLVIDRVTQQEGVVLHVKKRHVPTSPTGG